MIEKPNPPNPRIIREDFLPEDDMLKNYRILKTQDKEGRDVYYPQYKFLGLFWLYIDANIKIRTFNDAIYYIKREIIAKRKPTVEYIELTEKDLDLPEPNPPLLKP
jgi:hypothetical protein